MRTTDGDHHEVDSIEVAAILAGTYVPSNVGAAERCARMVEEAVQAAPRVEERERLYTLAA